MAMAFSPPLEAAKAVSDAKAEHDRIIADSATAQQSTEALQQQPAQLYFLAAAK